MFDRRMVFCLTLVSIFLTSLGGWSGVCGQESRLHPWIATAPGEFVRLIDRGNVAIATDDERIRQAGKSALTLFQFVVDYDFKLRHQTMGYDSEAMVWKVKMVAWMDRPKVRLTHTICLLSSFQPSSPWDSKLLRHEFDHVAISTDPRLDKFIKRALQMRRAWIAEFSQTAAPTEQDLRKSVYEKMVGEMKLIEQLVQCQYDHLDKETAQGLSDLQKRETFFRELYSAEGFARCKYPMDASTKMYVKDKLSSAASDKECQSHYLFLSP